MSSPILIIGTLPKTAGIGGVTIHIERLIKWLEKESFDVDLCDYKATSLSKQVKQIAKHKIIHIHASHPILRLFYVAISMLLGKKSILTIHGDLGRFSTIKNWIDKLAVSLCTVPIVINDKSFEKAKKWNKQTRLMSAFIPPYEDGFVPTCYLQQIAELKEDGKTLYCTNASARSFTNKGEEIYGIDFLIHYFSDYANDSILIVSDPSKDYIKHYNKSFKNVIFISEIHSFFAVLKNADVMIRATATDGDAISIKEALYLKKPTIATNRVPRPKEVILFEYNNLKSFSKALEQAKIKTYNSDFTEATVTSIKNLYTSLLTK